jgi:SAM-dependent methyltransferase
VEPHIPVFAQFEKWRDKKVLDLGCGIGTMTVSFALAGAKVTAVDISATSLEIARQRAKVYGLEKQIEFKQANIEELSIYLEPRPFDLIWSFGVIHHTPKPERAISEIRKNFVGRDSILKVMVYNRYSFKVLKLILADPWGAAHGLDELVANYSEAQDGCPVTYSYTANTVTSFLSGFQVIDIYKDHIFPYKIPDYIKYKYIMNWYFRILPRNLFRKLERVLGWHLCVTARPM